MKIYTEKGLQIFHVGKRNDNRNHIFDLLQLIALFSSYPSKCKKTSNKILYIVINGLLLKIIYQKLVTIIHLLTYPNKDTMF